MLVMSPIKVGTKSEMIPYGLRALALYNLNNSNQNVYILLGLEIGQMRTLMHELLFFFKSCVRKENVNYALHLNN